MVNYIDGDLIKLAKEGKFDVIVHGCNCFSTMGSGIAVQMAEAFGCDKFHMEEYESNEFKLGNIDFKIFNSGFSSLTVVNVYTQYRYGRDKVHFDYEAFTICMRKIDLYFRGKHIGMPKIGSDRAGGDWNRIEKIIEAELKDCKVTIVNYKQV